MHESNLGLLCGLCYNNDNKARTSAIVNRFNK